MQHNHFLNFDGKIIATWIATKPDLGAVLGSLPAVVAVAGEQAHALAVALDDQAMAVVLDLVCQSGPAGTFGLSGWNAGFNRGLGMRLT